MTRVVNRGILGLLPSYRGPRSVPSPCRGRACHVGRERRQLGGLISRRTGFDSPAPNQHGPQAAAGKHGPSKRFAKHGLLAAITVVCTPLSESELPVPWGHACNRGFRCLPHQSLWPLSSVGQSSESYKPQVVGSSPTGATRCLTHFTTAGRGPR